jgi:integrase
MGFAARLHLPFAQWPAADRALWQQANEADDPFSAGATAHLSSASRTRYLMGWRRFLGFLALTEPEVLEIPPAERIYPDRVKRFARHLGETCSPVSVAACVEAAYHAARVMMPGLDLGWLKQMKTRLFRAVPPKRNTRPAITSLQLLELGQPMMDEVRSKFGTKLRLTEAVKYRDGLIFALTAFMPLRRKNLAALDMLEHLQFDGGTDTIVIPKLESKTGAPIEFEIPETLLPYFQDYERFVRPRVDPRNIGTGLWLSRNGKKLAYGAFGDLFARHSTRRLGFRLRPHDVRAAAATTWAVFSPEKIEVAQELLAHKDIRTTTAYYNRARGIEASRHHLKVLKKIKRSR